MEWTNIWQQSEKSNMFILTNDRWSGSDTQDHKVRHVIIFSAMLSSTLTDTYAVHPRRPKYERIQIVFSTLNYLYLVQVENSKYSTPTYCYQGFCLSLREVMAAICTKFAIFPFLVLCSWHWAFRTRCRFSEAAKISSTFPTKLWYRPIIFQLYFIFTFRTNHCDDNLSLITCKIWKNKHCLTIRLLPQQPAHM